MVNVNDEDSVHWDNLLVLSHFNEHRIIMEDSAMVCIQKYCKHGGNISRGK